MGNERIQKAIDLATRYGQTDGAHHKAWVIDQMVRALTGCPMEVRTKHSWGQDFTYETQGESDEYQALMIDYRAGEDGPDTYEWDEGIAP